MTTSNALSFIDFLNPNGAEFPYCCLSGFYMTYNTSLRDPFKWLFSEDAEAPEKIVQKEISRSKKTSRK